MDPQTIQIPNPSFSRFINKSLVFRIWGFVRPVLGLGLVFLGCAKEKKRRVEELARQLEPPSDEEDFISHHSIASPFPAHAFDSGPKLNLRLIG